MCMALDTVFVALSYVVQIEAVTNGSPVLYLALFLCWTHAQVGLAFFIAALFTRARMVSILGYVFIIAMSVATAIGEPAAACRAWAPAAAHH